MCLRPSSISPEQARSLAQRIVHEHQFRFEHPSLLERFESWIGRGFDDLQADLFSGGALTHLGVVVALVVVAAAVFAVIRLGSRVRRDPKLEVVAPALVRRKPVEWLAEAARHEAAGEWRDALRCRYRALVAELSGRGVVEEFPGRTVREYEAQVRARLPLGVDEFVEASDLFEAAWYGNMPAGRGQDERFRELASAVVGRAPR